MSFMKKKVAKKKAINFEDIEVPANIVGDAGVPYITKNFMSLPALKDFNYKEFKKIADKVPFSLSEWANILHISERTLQRYAKDNSTFAPINAERALMIAKVIKEAVTTFGSTNAFYGWIKQKPYMLEGNLSFEALTTTDGIQRVLTQLKRIQYGILA
jgi:putative toxin-antitoxin system antitoxin component (TIGR02293 family)